MKNKNTNSPAWRAWRKFRRNIAAMIGLFIITVATLLAIVGYLVVPDNTTHANQQIVELKLKEPGYTAKLLKVKLDNPVEDRNLLEIFWNGKEREFRYIPILNYSIAGDTIYYEHYIGRPDEGLPEQISINEVLGNEKGRVRDIQSYIESEAIISRTFLLGTDAIGRDYFSRLILGTRVSIAVGLMAVVISLIIGIFLGAVAGYFRGWVDDAIMYVISVFWSVPTLLLALSLALVLEKGLWQVFVAIGLTMWIDLARIVRGQILSLREMEFVEAANSLGFNHSRIIFRHILPNIIGPVTVIVAANFSAAILLEAGLSFLGLGVERPMPSWGMMLSDNRTYLIAGLSHLAIIPGIAICLLVLSFFMVGNGLRDAFDVKTKINY